MNDSIGDRMKNNYENRTRYFLPRRTYTIIRIDGKAFHSYCKNFTKPYDEYLMKLMDNTAQYLCENIQGCKLAFVQSDEISLILTDFDDITTEAYFDGNIQKIASVSASMATAKFNSLVGSNTTLACFDARVFSIPDPVEVSNYLIWRQQDATRNSIQMTGQAYFSHAELQNKSCNTIQEMLWQEKSINWNDMPDGFKRGRCVRKLLYDIEGVQRSKWIIECPPVFTQEIDYIWKYIPSPLRS